MIRILIVAAVLVVIAFVAAQLAAQPGQVSFQWLGYQIETSFATLIAAVLVILVVLMLLHRLWVWIASGPKALRQRGQRRRQQKGLDALTKGLVAVAAGDADEANRMAMRAEGYFDEKPLPLLLSAQAAQLAGNEAVAEERFKEMSEHSETEFLGVRGLLVQAKRRGDHKTALRLAERANLLRPKTPWVSSELFALQAANGDWQSAQSTLDYAVKHKLVEASDAGQRGAIVLYGQAEAAQQAGEIDHAIKYARQALKRGPGFLPAIILAARLMAENDMPRRALRLIEDVWRDDPHPDLVPIHAGLAGKSDAATRLKQAKALAALNPDHEDSRIAIATAAMAMQDWTQAKTALAPLADGDAPSVRVCRMMADLSEQGDKDNAAARRWLHRAASAPNDAIWVCNQCSRQVRQWVAHCPDCTAFDSFEWRRPTSPLPLVLPHIEADPPAPAAEAAEAAQEVKVEAKPADTKADVNADTDAKTPAAPAKKDPPKVEIMAPEKTKDAAFDGPGGSGDDDPHAETLVSARDPDIDPHKFDITSHSKAKS